MAKRAVKKVKKKSPVKKSSSKKPGLSSLPPLETCLKGKIIALAGRSLYPDRSTLERFYRSHGATISKTVDGRLDILLVSDGQKSTAQTRAEKLNAKGDANILIIDQPILAFSNMELNRIDYLTSPDQVIQFCTFVKMDRSDDRNFSQIDGVNFSKKTIGPDRVLKDSGGVDLQMIFHNCCFDRATIQNVTLGRYADHSSNCELNGSTFNSVDFRYLNQFNFNKCKGSSLKLVRAEDCQLNDMVLDKIEFSHTEKITISNSKFKIFQVDNRVTNHSMENVNIGLLRAVSFDGITSCEISSSEFSKVTVAGTEIADTMKCVGSTFKDCKFSKLDVDSVKFVECELINCTFDGLKTVDLGFCDKTKLKNCRFVKPNVGLIGITETQLAATKGLPKTIRRFTPTTHPNLHSLAETIVKSKRFELSLGAIYQKTKTVRLSCLREHETTFHFADPKAEAHTGGTVASYMTSPNEVNDVFRGLGYWITASKASDVNLETIILKASKSPIKGKALKELVIAAIFEGMGAESRSADEIKSAEKESAAKSSEIKKAVKAELIAGDVKKLNKRPASERLLASPIKKADFSKVNLAGAKLAGFEFRHCNFTGANLSKVDLSKGVAASCDFTNANLKEAKLTGCDLSNSVFNEADATKAVLSLAILTKTEMDKTNFAGANFSKSPGDYRSFHKYQADLATCNLKGADFTNCTYDAKTRLPENCSKTMLEKMEWCGPGLPPDQRKHSKKAAGPLDFETFMERLTEITDTSRLKKSLKMLKADSFELFSEVEDDRVAGVVKSQSDAKLVYSCTLQQSGEFSCCTQNLNPCGGLRGSLCKHILVLLVGLAKSGELDPTKVDQWINASKMKSPELDKDRMGEVLLKYKGAEAGEIDWRPTETVPEDFMAF